jgi:hypothetical protein
VRAPGLAIVLLIAITAIGVYKPWGLTRYGRRRQLEKRGISQQPEHKTPTGIKVLFAVGALLVLGFIVLHLTGHGFGMHAH